MNLSDLTPTQKNELIHTRIMLRRVEEPCIGETVDTDDEWFCCACGAKGGIATGRLHPLPVPNYFQDLNIAWRIFDNTGPLVGVHAELWRGAQNIVRCIIHNYPQYYSNVIAFSHDDAASALCKAALYALHIVREDDESIQE